MESLIINKGYKEYSINNDERAVIRIKTTDFSVIDKLYHLRENVTDTVKRLEQLKQSDSAGIDEILNAVKAADTEVKQELDRIFDDSVSAKVFGGMNCLSFAGGQPVAANFLEAIIPRIKADLETEQSAANEKLAAYIEAAAQFS